MALSSLDRRGAELSMGISVGRANTRFATGRSRLLRASALALLLAPSCARFGYDLSDAVVAAGSGGGLGVGASGAASLGGAAWVPDASSGAGGGAETVPSDGAPDAAVPPTAAGAGGGGQGGAGQGQAGQSGAGGADAVDEVCVLRGDETVVNGFDTGTNGALARGAGSPAVAWNGVDGTPSPGCLEYTNPAGGRGEVRYDGMLGDLSSRRVSVNVRGVSGANVSQRLFVETGPSQLRASGVSVPAASGWRCLTLDLSAPAAAEPGFDARDIRAVGVEIDGDGSVRSQIDQVAY